MNVYDFDNTIYKGDSTFDFYKFCLKRHKKIITLFPSLICAFAKYYVFKIGTKTQFKEKMYLFLTKINLEKDLEDFWKLHKKNIKQWYINQHKDTDVIISASPLFLLTPICKELEIKHLIASDVCPKTGKYTGINCHGEEKVRLYYLEFSENIDEFYSDSYSDTPLAKISKNAFMVKDNKITKWEFKKTNHSTTNIF